MFTLRDYQKQAVEKLIWSQKFPEPDLCVLPTGAGKSLVIADLVHRLNKETLILQPSREILQQNLAKMLTYTSRDEVGVYSASMNEKTIKPITFATIGSIYKKPHEFLHFKQIIIDECHGVNAKNLDGMFTTFLRSIGSPKVVGFTATPYRQAQMYERLETGELLTHTTTKIITRTNPRFWHRIMYNINNAELVRAGYLVPIKYFDRSIIEHGQIPINKSKSDFDLTAYERTIFSMKDKLLESVFLAQELSSGVLVFCSSVEQAKELCELTPDSQVVTAQTPAKLRSRIVEDFKSGKTRTVFNVGVFTIGFDHPALDCIVLLRPTRSIALYYQMLGRGVRISPGKKLCRVIDMTGTVKQLGRIETIKMEKIENKWELTSENGSWHNKSLYSYQVPPRPVKTLF